MSPPGHQSEKNPAGDSKEPCGTENGGMTMNRSTFHTIGAVAATAVMLASCAKNEVISRRPALDPDAIAFSVSSGFVPVDMPESKSGSGGQAEEKPAVLLGDNGDTLYLHPSVVPNERGFSAVPETRGVPIEDPSGIDSFFVTAKINDGGSETPDALYIDEEEVTHIGEGGTIWTTSEGQHFWPDESTALDFYAYANFDNNSPVTNLVCENGKLGFSYTVSSGSEGSDAVQQPDILFALASASRSQTNEGDGTVDLNFEHALAGVQFRAKNIAGGTIKSITIKNVYGQGDCTYSLSDSPVVEGTVTKNGTFKWTTTGTTVKFKQDMDVSVDESSTLPDGTLQDVTTGANNEMTFMMIPQKLENVEVEIKLIGNLDKKEYRVSGNLTTATGTWEAGNLYIYDISTDSINWTYVFEVSDNITFELGQTSEPYTVTSYRFRTQLGDKEENREPVPWTATNTGASETDPSNDQTSSVDINDIVTSFTSNGDGSVKGAQSYTLGLVRGTLHTDYHGDKTLQGAEYKGLETAPYDLSTSGGTLSQETANCYAINAPGTYKLPLVYGNAIKNGGYNDSAYNNSAFTDYKGERIDNPYIYNRYEPGDACLVWSDGFYMFENVHLDEQKQWLIFSVNRDYMQQANAILAVRDKEGTIMWSWHIWVTERNLVGTAHTLQDWNSSTTYGLLPCNLGWVDGKMVYYNSRKLTYEFTQETSGYKQTMIVDQAGAEFDYKDVGSTYYQWGRKDPIVALRNWDTYKFEDYRLHETSDPKYRYDIRQEQVPISTTIQNPNIYYTATSSNGSWNTNWCNSAISTLWDNSQGTGVSKDSSVKTIYDPSPRGYKVPIPRAFSVFVKGNTKSGATGQNAINGYQIGSGDYNQYRVKPNRDGSGAEIPLTATGQRADRDGLEAYSSAEGKISEPGGLWAMYGVYYWTCMQVVNSDGTPNGNAAFSLCIRHDKGSNDYYYTYGFVGAKTMARPVRCIEDR